MFVAQQNLAAGDKSEVMDRLLVDAALCGSSVLATSDLYRELLKHRYREICGNVLQAMGIADFATPDSAQQETETWFSASP